ncbi:hypothetical protein NL676_029707 [Syzygium grande]|nr:hypothetical protein NL676_029707 [Syzygium grande]
MKTEARPFPGLAPPPPFLARFPPEPKSLRFPSSRRPPPVAAPPPHFTPSGAGGKILGFAGKRSLLLSESVLVSCLFFPLGLDRDSGANFEPASAQNSSNFSLLRVHPLSLQVHMYYQLSYQLGPYERYPVPIDTNVSGGMNRFLWLSERNVLTNVIPSPIHGLEDIVNNQVYNVTLSQSCKAQAHPQATCWCCRSSKVLGPLDNKPFPVLWHEDNSGRRQNGRERPSVPGAMVGPMLGEAAHRLVKSTLNIKLNNNQSSGILEPPRNRNFPVYYAVNRPRPAAPSLGTKGASVKIPTSTMGITTTLLFEVSLD